MKGKTIAKLRMEIGLDQQEAARRLGLSQTYLSLIESGKRKVTAELTAKAVRLFNASPEFLPFDSIAADSDEKTNEVLAEMLASLGYPRFSHLPKSEKLNPAFVLFSALRKTNLDSRVAEALPWLVHEFPKMDWHFLINAAKLSNLQNRLGFIVSLARQLAEENGNVGKLETLKYVEEQLKHSILFREDQLVAATKAEANFLKDNRTESAKFWRVLSDLSVEHLKPI